MNGTIEREEIRQDLRAMRYARSAGALRSIGEAMRGLGRWDATAFEVYSTRMKELGGAQSG